MPVDTPLAEWSRVAVFACNPGGCQTGEPAAVQIVDHHAQMARPEARVSALRFRDTDTDIGEIGGDVTWTFPVATRDPAGTVSHVVAFLARDGTGQHLAADASVSVEVLV